MLLTRILTAAVLLAGFFAALFLVDAFWFTVVVGVVIAIAAYEWGKLTGIGAWLVLASTGACVYIWLGFLDHPRSANALFIAATVFWIAIAPAWLSRGMLPAPAGAMPWAMLIVLIPAGVAMVALPRDYLLFLLGIVWIADIAAYFTGRAFGKRKLAPTISPGKTWEGVVGAGIFCLIYAIICAMFVPSLRNKIQGAVWAFFLVGAMVVCAASILGDLFESALKRRAGKKDSGSILPGHGGVLDRIDGITAALPIGALLMRWLETA